MIDFREVDLSQTRAQRSDARAKAKFDSLVTALFEKNAKEDSVKLRGAEIILSNTKDLNDPAEYDNAIEALNDISSTLTPGAAKSVAKAYGTALGQNKRTAVANNMIMDSLVETEKALNALYEGGQWKTSDAIAILDNLKSTSKEFKPKATRQASKALDAALGNISNQIDLANMFASVDTDPNEPGVQHYNQDIRSGWSHFLAGDLKRATTRLDAGKKKTSEDNWAKWEDKYARDRASLDDLFNKHIKEGVSEELFEDLRPLLPTQKLKLHADTLPAEQKRLTSALDLLLKKSDIENDAAENAYKKSGADGFIVTMASEAAKDKIDLNDPIALATWLKGEMDMPGFDIFGSEHEKAGSEIMAGLMQSYLTLDYAWEELSSSSGSTSGSLGGSSGLFE